MTTATAPSNAASSSFGAPMPLHPQQSSLNPNNAFLVSGPQTPRSIDEWNARLRTRSEQIAGLGQGHGSLTRNHGRGYFEVDVSGAHGAGAAAGGGPQLTFSLAAPANDPFAFLDLHHGGTGGPASVVSSNGTSAVSNIANPRTSQSSVASSQQSQQSWQQQFANYQQQPPLHLPQHLLAAEWDARSRSRSDTFALSRPLNQFNNPNNHQQQQQQSNDPGYFFQPHRPDLDANEFNPHDNLNDLDLVDDSEHGISVAFDDPLGVGTSSGGDGLEMDGTQEMDYNETGSGVEFVDPYAQQPVLSQQPSSAPNMPSYPNLSLPLLREIGVGAFATVYASTLPSGKPCAVKVVTKSLLTPKQRSDVLKEVQLLRRLNHPNIIKLLDFGEGQEAGGGEGYFYLVLELMEGGELFTRVQEMTFFSESAARRCIVQVALAVLHLHRLGIVHRDIKLENLLYQPSPTHDYPQGDPRVDEDAGVGSLKLADFGLAKEVFSASTATPCGTIGYTAPEIVLSQSYSKNVDIWALGCVLYTLLCGYPPFGGEAEEVTRRVAGGGWEFGRPWWDHVGWEAKDLISNALVLDPSRRFTIEQFLSHPWILPELQRLGIPPPAPVLPVQSLKPSAVAVTPSGWKVPGRLDTPAEERGRMNWATEEDHRIQKTPSPGTPGKTPSPYLDGAIPFDWSTLAAMAHERGLVAQQETLREHPPPAPPQQMMPRWDLPPSNQAMQGHGFPMLSPMVRTPLTREAIDASYFAVRGLEDAAEAAQGVARLLPGTTTGIGMGMGMGMGALANPAGNAVMGNGRPSPPFLPATASIAFGGAAMPSGMITPGGSVRNVNFGIIRPNEPSVSSSMPPPASSGNMGSLPRTAGGLLGSSLLRKTARTPGAGGHQVGPSPLAWSSTGPPSIPMSDASTPSSDGSALPQGHGLTGGAAGFELNLGESSLLARRKGGKKASTDPPGGFPEPLKGKPGMARTGTEVEEGMKRLGISGDQQEGR